jgi:hypothetical protein
MTHGFCSRPAIMKNTSLLNENLFLNFVAVDIASFLSVFIFVTPLLVLLLLSLPIIYFIICQPFQQKIKTYYSSCNLFNQY